MRTPSQISASRSNGAKSKGPVTAQGKRNSSRNSTRHGLFAETIVLDAEETPRFLELLHELIEEHQPQTPTERMLVDTIAAARWRQDRIWGLQKTAFDYDIAHPPAGPHQPAPSAPLAAVLSLRSSEPGIRVHELLLRYEIALDRQISRALLRLLQLQSKRAAQPEPPSDPAGSASVHAEPSQTKLRPVHPILAKIPASALSLVHSSEPAKRTQQPVENTRKAAEPLASVPPPPSTRQVRF